MTRFTHTLRAVAVAVFAVTATACSSDGGSVEPIDVPPKLTIVRGAGATDTIQSRIYEAIVAEVRGKDGKPAAGVPVSFTVPAVTDASRKSETLLTLCNVRGLRCVVSQNLVRDFVDTTDATGRSAALVSLGSIPGRVVVRINVESAALSDSAVFNVTAGNAVRVRAFSTDTSVNLGTSITLGGRTLDRFNNPRADVVTVIAGAGSAITVTPSGVVTTTEMGEQWTFTRFGDFTDSTLVRAVPAARLVAWDALAQAVRIMNSDGSNKRTLVTNIATSIGVFPHFETDRRQVMMFGTNISTTNFTLIDTSGAPRRDFNESFGFRAIQAVRLLANGSILVAAWGNVPQDYYLWRVNTDNTVTKLWALTGMLSDAGGHADISPDGTRIVYQAYTASPNGRELRVMDVATGAQNVVVARGTGPRWSPQSDRILFLPCDAPDGPACLATIINADGSGRRTVGTTAYTYGFAWSPDGAYIIGRGVVDPARRLQITRLSNLARVTLRFRAANGDDEDYYQPDWR